LIEVRAVFVARDARRLPCARCDGDYLPSDATTSLRAARAPQHAAALLGFEYCW
jgi:hypothetical protein